MKKYKVLKLVCNIIIVFLLTNLFLALIGTVAYAGGLIDNTIDTTNEYSKYALDNYQLDFYVDTSWSWLPWNWVEGIGKQVMYGLYAITNFIWTISLLLSSATGYLVQEAYRLDFISQTADTIGKNIQTIAGVTKNGFSTSGFYVGFLLILVFILGIYVAYTGLLKRETTKAIRAVINFVVIFIISSGFIAFAPDYIVKVNDFSSDLSNASLTIGTKLVMPNSNIQGGNSVDLIRDNLFSIQVKQPWLLLQYGTTDIESLGEDRVENLLSTSPDSDNGKERQKIVEDEIENENNTNLTLPKTISRLGMVFFLFIFNIGISIFVFLLTGIMIFSQILFIIFAMFLPISLLLSMIPSFESTGKRAVIKLFNVIMTRAGITLIITVAFSISTMWYSLSGSSPFFMIAFLQIVTFAGIYFKLSDLMNMFSLQSNDSQSMGRQFARRPRMFLHRQTRKLQRKLGRTMQLSNRNKVGGNNPTSSSKQKSNDRPNHNTSKTNRYQDDHVTTGNQDKPLSKRMGEKVGTAMDSKDRVKDKAGSIKDSIKPIPTQARYSVHKGKESVKDFTKTVEDTRKNKSTERMDKRNRKRTSIAQRRLELEKYRNDKKNKNVEPYASVRKYEKSKAQSKNADQGRGNTS